MRMCSFALMLSASALLQGASVLAQQSTQVGPEPLGEIGTPIEPQPAGSPEAAPANPFRDFNAPSVSTDDSGFAEATDQDLLSPNPPRNQSVNNRPTPSRRRTPARASSASTASTSSRNNNAYSPRLARAAPIMGDSLSPTLQFIDPFDETVADIPTGGSATRRKIGENTGAFPTDRLIFNYNHFQNAVESVSESTNIDRYTMGLEKTFFDQMCSIDVRLPLSANNDFVDPNGAFRRNGSELGNVSVALKCLLTSSDNCALAAGLVVDTPTGSGTTAMLANGDMLKFNNEAVHLAPFLGFLLMHEGDFTHQGFLQVDVATNANGFVYAEDPTLTTPEIVSTDFEEQTLLYFDYSLAKAFFRGRDLVRRASGLVEFHYTTTLEDSDVIVINTVNSDFDLSSAGNRIDVLNLTLGIDTLLSGGTNVRFGAVVPINDGDDRFFDAEFLAQVNIPL